jgi:hypothetical protein
MALTERGRDIKASKGKGQGAILAKKGRAKKGKTDRISLL